MKRTMSCMLALGLALTGVLGAAAPAVAAPAVAAPAVAAPAVTAPAVAAPALTITARYALLGDTPDTVVLVGKYTCGPYTGGAPERGVIDLEVVQTVNGVRVNGIGYLEPTVCTGEPQWYVAELTAYTGQFVPGRGAWGASGYLEGPEGMQHVHVPPTPIRIRGISR